MARGYFCLVLHTHLPFVRGAGVWPFGEATLFQAVAETYLPLLEAMYDLVAEGHSPKVTLGLTPILLEQLDDSALLSRLEAYLKDKRAMAQADGRRFQKEGPDQLADLAEFYRNWYDHLLTAFRRRFHRDLVGAFRRLQDEGHIEILTGAATHAYLPLLEHDSSIYGQLKVGVDTYRRHFGRDPQGIWLPECGYRPAYLKDGKPKPGIEEFLANLGLRYFFTDSYALTGGPLLGKVAGDVRGPYGAVPRRLLIAKTLEWPMAVQATTFRPYFVQDSPVAVFARNERTGLQVWSETFGYPGDPTYREFHRQAPDSGLQYWRVTGPAGDLGQKELYRPEPAMERVKEHARHFAGVVEAELEGYFQQGGEPGILAAAYDTELFGHWWFEGVAFLEEVLRLLDQHPTVKVATVQEYLELHPPREAIALPESSWGLGGGHATWLNPETKWMWPLIRRAEHWMEELVAAGTAARGRLRQVLNQAARELLLLEASDWPFLVTTQQAKGFSAGRFQKHLSRFHHLASIAQKGRVSREDTAYLKDVAESDNPFPNIDYRIFIARESD